MRTKITNYILLLIVVGIVAVLSFGFGQRDSFFNADFWAERSFYRGLLVSCYSIYGDEEGCRRGVARAMTNGWYQSDDPIQLQLREWKPRRVN